MRQQGPNYACSDCKVYIADMPKVYSVAERTRQANILLPIKDYGRKTRDISVKRCRKYAVIATYCPDCARNHGLITL